MLYMSDGICFRMVDRSYPDKLEVGINGRDKNLVRQQVMQ